MTETSAAADLTPIDRIQLMFNLQKTLQKRIKQVDLPRTIPDEIPETVTAIIAELGEILEDFQAWKSWRKVTPAVDREHLLEEVTDLWHFIINLSLYLGFDADDIFEKFKAKNAENHARQDRGY